MAGNPSTTLKLLLMDLAIIWLPNVQTVISANQITRISNTTPLVTYYSSQVADSHCDRSSGVIKRVNKSNYRS